MFSSKKDSPPGSANPLSHLPEDLARQGVPVLIQALDQTVNSVIITDVRGVILYVNQGFERSTGYSRQEVLGKHTRILKSGKHPPEFYEQMWSVLQAGESWSGQFHNRRKDGVFFWEQATISPVKDSRGQITHYLAIKEDISPLQKAHDTLQSERRQLMEILDLVPHMIYLRDKNNRYLMVNQAVADFLHLEKHQIVGSTDVELSFDQQAAFQRKQEDQEVIHSRRPMLQRELSLQLTPDQKGYFQSVRVPFDLLGENETAVLGIMVDISRQKLDEQQLVRSKEEAMRSMRERAFFLSVMTHEIRTPLTTILGMARLLQNNDLEDELRENLEVLSFAAENLMGLVNNILDFSRIERGKVEFEKRPFHLKHHLKKISQTFAPRAREKNLDLDVFIDPDIPQWVQGDSLRLGQILNNLLGNALKFTNRGKVLFSAKVMEQSGQKVRIEFLIRDTGIGIPSEKLDTLFEPFTQANLEIARRYGGSGLGLAITRQLVEGQGGSIRVQSNLRQGSEFSFILDFIPLAPPQPAPLAEQKSLHNFQNLDVLMVEDNVMSIILARKIFSKWKLNLFLAESAGVALERITSKTFDVILLDLQIPGMDGFQIMERIKDASVSKNADTPVIAFTASTEPQIHEKALDAGMKDVIVKPYEPQELLERMEFHVMRQRQSPPKVADPSLFLHDCLRKHLNDLPLLKTLLESIIQVLGLPADHLADHLPRLQQQVLPTLRNLCLQRQAEQFEDFLRVMDSPEGRNSNQLLDVLRADMKKQTKAILELVHLICRDNC